jgi:hypothetical protein
MSTGSPSRVDLDIHAVGVSASSTRFVGATGAFKGKGTGAAGNVQFTGHIQALGDRGGAGDQGGALVRAIYKFIFPDGTEDKGMTDLLRSFTRPDPCLPPDPCEPPDITGSYSGTSTSDLTGRQETLTVDITSQDRFSFEGVEIVGGIAPCVIVGTIGVTGHFVIIGVGDAGRVLEGGRFEPPPDDGLTGTFFRTGGATGPVDLGAFTLDRVVR